MKTLLAALALAALSSVPSTPSAQGVESAPRRRQLIDRADAAMRGGDHARALAWALEAGEILMTPSLRLRIAQEHYRLGHLRDAAEAALRCAHEANINPTLPNGEQIESACERIEAMTRDQIGYVILLLPPGEGGEPRVILQGAALDDPARSTGHPVSPGPVVIEATCGRATFHREVFVRAGAIEVVEVLWQRPSPAIAPAVLPPRTAPARGSGRPQVDAPSAGPWIVAGLGGALLGSALAFYLLRVDALADSRAACPSPGCLPAPFALASARYDRAETFDTLTYVALGVGAAAVAGGVSWYLVRVVRGERSPRAALTGLFVPTPAGVSLHVGGAL